MNRLFSLLPALLFILSACGDAAEPVAHGYVEGDFLFVGAETAGRITQMNVREGGRVAAGAALFALDTRVEEMALKAARERAEEEQARLEDLLRGARPPRIAALEAALTRAEADRELARQQLERIRGIRGSPAFSPERLDETEAAYKAAEAGVTEAREELALARLPAREKEIEAARHAHAAALAEAARLEEEIARHRVAAPTAAIVQEVLRREGEVAEPGKPILTLLPADGRRAVFFVPQLVAPRLERGMEVTVTCDGCPKELRASIDFIDAEVAFTPPVIFSPEQRKRLMVRVEAKLPPDMAPALRPGQPITVHYGEHGEGRS